jgi:hypothetical protein
MLDSYLELPKGLYAFYSLLFSTNMAVGLFLEESSTAGGGDHHH